MLSAHDLSVRRGGQHLLDGVTVSLAPGRVTAILGPNGAGKSTLLKCLSGLVGPDGGSISVADRPLTGLDARERAGLIGYLPQQAELHWNISVGALVALGRLPHTGGSSRLSAHDKALVDQALAATDAAQWADRLARTLSGGEQARVLLARVLAGEPDWILADEPFAALDLAHRFDLADRLRAIAHGGTGVVVVLHDIALAGRLADDVLLLDKGRVVASGPVAEVLASPRIAEVFGVNVERIVLSDGTETLVPVRRFP
jgi:iron complex transport system ATP-binding protein